MFTGYRGHHRLIIRQVQKPGKMKGHLLFSTRSLTISDAISEHYKLCVDEMVGLTMENVNPKG
jgi:hypothetical protein